MSRRGELLGRVWIDASRLAPIGRGILLKTTLFSLLPDEINHINIDYISCQILKVFQLTCILVRIQSSGFVIKLADKLLSGPHRHCTAKVGISFGRRPLRWPFLFIKFYLCYMNIRCWRNFRKVKNRKEFIFLN